MLTQSDPPQRQTTDLTSTEKTSGQACHEPDCPFCLGNEDRTGPSLYTLPGQDGDWALRVVRNKYPAVEVMELGGAERRRGDHDHDHDGLILNLSEDARGYHDVIVETPEHNVPLALDGIERTEMLLRAWRDRGAQIAAEDDRVRHLLCESLLLGLLVRSFVRWFARSLVRSFVRSLVRSFGDIL